MDNVTLHAPTFFEWESSQATVAETDGCGYGGGGGGDRDDPLSDAVKDAVQGQVVEDLQVMVQKYRYRSLLIER